MTNFYLHFSHEPLILIPYVTILQQRFQGGFQGESQQSQNIVAKVESARVDPIKIPLCAYVEEKIEEVAEPQVNQTENKAFLDPQLGSVVTLVEIHVSEP